MAVSKYSRQRELIFNAVIENQVHPTAEFVYNYLKKDNPQLSLGTVYRNLQQLSERGDIARVSMPNQPDRFDGVLKPHYHLLCPCCGNIEDVYLDELTDIGKLVEEKTNRTVLGHEIVFKSICPSCEQ